MILFMFFSKVSAQSDSVKVPTKVVFGVVFSSSGITTFSDFNNPFVLSQNLSPNVCFVTKKTYHNVLYGFNNNAIRDVNGYFLNRKKDLGLYLSLGKNLSIKNGYVGIGFEKLIKSGDLLPFLFAEGQIILWHDSKIRGFQLCLGTHINIQTLIGVF